MFIFQCFFNSAAILAGEFANFANSKHTPLGEETLTSGYNEHLFLVSRQLSQARSVSKGPALVEGLLTSTSQNGYLYVAGKGTLACYDAKTGKQQYNESLPKMSRLIACPVATGDLVLVLNKDGSTAMIKAGPKFEVVGSGKLDDNFWSSPAVATCTFAGSIISTAFAKRSPSEVTSWP